MAGIARKNRRHEDNPLITHQLPNSIPSEQFRTIRTNIEFSMVEKQMKTMAVTAATPAAGKSWVAANLAVTFANNHARVLLVDTDLRRPTVHKYLKLSNRTGLTNLLRHDAPDFEEVLQPTMVDNLSVLTAGPIPPNPAELLGSHYMKKLENQLKDSFDLIIFDTLPLLAFADAQIVASQCDGVLFVVESGKTTKDDVDKAANLLRNVDANVVGAIYNKDPIQVVKNSYYGYGYN